MRRRGECGGRRRGNCAKTTKTQRSQNRHEFGFSFVNFASLRALRVFNSGERKSLVMIGALLMEWQSTGGDARVAVGRERAALRARG
jgi:hypothetical protein